MDTMETTTASQTERELLAEWKDLTAEFSRAQDRRTARLLNLIDQTIREQVPSATALELTVDPIRDRDYEGRLADRILLGDGVSALAPSKIVAFRRQGATTIGYPTIVEMTVEHLLRQVVQGGVASLSPYVKKGARGEPVIPLGLTR